MSPKPNLRLAGPPPDLVPGGPVEFDELFARYGRYVARLASRLLGSGDTEVDDVVQDVFWLASRRLPTIVDMIQARGWLATVTTRLVARRLRRRRFRRLFHDEPVADRRCRRRGRRPNSARCWLGSTRCWRRLPTAERVAWSLRYLEGEPLDIVAAACRCSLATAKRRVSAAKKVIDEVFGDDKMIRCGLRWVTRSSPIGRRSAKRAVRAAIVRRATRRRAVRADRGGSRLDRVDRRRRRRPGAAGGPRSPSLLRWSRAQVRLCARRQPAARSGPRPSP